MFLIDDCKKLPISRLELWDIDSSQFSDILETLGLSKQENNQ